MRTFEMTRKADESGVSGTGKVAEGVVFESGYTVLRHPSNLAVITFADGEVLEAS